MEIIKFQKAKLERNKLVIDETISLDEWKELGQSLKQVEGSVQFWIGDWARFGEKKGFTGKYVAPQVYDELEEITGVDRRTLQDYKTVADRVSAGRHADLSFSHHREVAPLEPEQQKEFLQMASDEKLSVRELRNEVKKTNEEKRNGMRTLQSINERLSVEKELIDLAKTINENYTKEQRIFLINQIKQ